MLLDLCWFVNSYGSCRCAYRFWLGPHGTIGKAALWYICNGDMSRSCRIEVSDLRFKV